MSTHLHGTLQHRNLSSFHHCKFRILSYPYELSFFEWQFLFNSIWIWRHGCRVITEQSDKYPMLAVCTFPFDVVARYPPTASRSTKLRFSRTGVVLTVSIAKRAGQTVPSVAVPSLLIRFFSCISRRCFRVHLSRGKLLVGNRVWTRIFGTVSASPPIHRFIDVNVKTGIRKTAAVVLGDLWKSSKGPKQDQKYVLCTRKTGCIRQTYMYESHLYDVCSYSVIEQDTSAMRLLWSVKNHTPTNAHETIVNHNMFLFLSETIIHLEPILKIL